MRKEAVCIIGASGYLGGHISDKLLRDKVDIALCYRNENKIKQNQIFKKARYHHEGDLTNKKYLDEILDGGYNNFIYLASSNHFKCEESLSSAMENNVNPLAYLVEQLYRNKKRCNFIYLSTAQIYGHQLKSISIDESTSVELGNNYALTHFICEGILSRYSDFINSISIRLTNTYGYPIYSSNDCWWFVVNDLCRQAVFDGKIQLLSDGSAPRDFINVESAADRVVWLLKQNIKNSSIYNLASGKTYRVIDVANIISSLMYKKYDVEVKIFKNNGQVVGDSQLNYGLNKFSTNSEYHMMCKEQDNLYKGIEVLLERLHSTG
jgi:UDP-glucose 4-epimerase